MNDENTGATSFRQQPEPPEARGETAILAGAAEQPEPPEARGETAILAGAAVLAAACIFWGIRGLRHDDAFILYQYARNIGSGQGFVFNPGEPVLGVSSPLVTGLLAGGYAAFGDVLPGASVLLSAAGMAVQALVLQRFARGALPVTAWALFGFTLLGLHGSYAFAALETNVYAALALAALWAMERNRPLACGLCVGLAFLCRHDAALLAPILLLRPRPIRARFLLITAGAAGWIVLPWLVFSFVYFGSWLPQTLAAKRGMMAFSDYLAGALDRIVGAPWTALGIVPGYGARAIGIGLALIGIAAVWRCLPLFRSFVLLCALHLAAYAAIGPDLDYHWHTYMPQLGYGVLLVLGTGWLVEGRRPGLRWRVARRVATAALALAVAAQLGRGALEFSRTLPVQFWHGLRNSRYEVVAAWVQAHVRPGQSFMANEVGTLGYLTRLRMIDPYGLINQTNDWPRTYKVHSFVDLVLRYRPDLILVDTPGLGKVLEASLGYRLVKVFPWGQPASTLLIRDPSVLLDPTQLEALRDSLGVPSQP